MDLKPRIQRDYSRFLRNGRRDPTDLPRYYRHYYDCNRYVDWEIGRVLDAVAAHLPEETAVIFTSDHGDHLGAFGLCAKGPTMYDHTIAVPLIIRPPAGAGSGGLRVDAVVSSVDLFPTMLDFAGVRTDNLTLAGGYAGRSLVPLAAGRADEGRDAVFVEYGRFGIGHDQDDGFFPIRCIRTGDWKLAINLLDTDELYHLAEDPEEERNLIADPGAASVRNELHDRLLDFQQQVRDPFRGPCWLSRPWRTDARRQFEGLFTTGWSDAWENRAFD
jgi:uncharacterized sulfatase